MQIYLGGVIRIFLHPGYIKSWSDGVSNHISAKRLAALYEIDLKHCIVININNSMEGYEEKEGDIHLRPLYSGDYRRIVVLCNSCDVAIKSGDSVIILDGINWHEKCWKKV